MKKWAIDAKLKTSSCQYASTMYLCKKINGMEYPIQPIEPADIAKLQHLDRETLLQQLKLFIIDLLIHDFERLCALMYRHDVNERLFNEALMCSTDDQRAEAIANLVIDREMLKIKTRAAYSRNNPKNSSDKD